MGILDHVNIFAGYALELKFRSKILGGVPKNPRTLEAWIRKGTGFTTDDQESRIIWRRTLAQMGIDVRDDITDEELMAISSSVATEKHGSGFKRDELGCYIEDRQVKSLLRESANILYPWGAKKFGGSLSKEGKLTGAKGAKNYLAERVFVLPEKIHLLRADPATGELAPVAPREDEVVGNGFSIESMVVHAVVQGKGPVSSLKYHEAIDQATIRFQMIVLHDCFSATEWLEIWRLGEELGLGASRSQSFGRFEVEKLERIEGVPPKILQHSIDASRDAEGRVAWSHRPLQRSVKEMVATPAGD